MASIRRATGGTRRTRRWIAHVCSEPQLIQQTLHFELPRDGTAALAASAGTSASSVALAALLPGGARAVVRAAVPKRRGVRLRGRGSFSTSARGLGPERNGLTPMVPPSNDAGVELNEGPIGLFKLVAHSCPRIASIEELVTKVFAMERARCLFSVNPLINHKW